MAVRLLTRVGWTGNLVLSRLRGYRPVHLHITGIRAQGTEQRSALNTVIHSKMLRIEPRWCSLIVPTKCLHCRIGCFPRCALLLRVVSHVLRPQAEGSLFWRIYAGRDSVSSHFRVAFSPRLSGSAVIGHRCLRLSRGTLSKYRPQGCFSNGLDGGGWRVRTRFLRNCGLLGRCLFAGSVGSCRR